MCVNYSRGAVIFYALPVSLFYGFMPSPVRYSLIRSPVMTNPTSTPSADPPPVSPLIARTYGEPRFHTEGDIAAVAFLLGVAAFA